MDKVDRNTTRGLSPVTLSRERELSKYQMGFSMYLLSNVMMYYYFTVIEK